jgi:hypothetical protein
MEIELTDITGATITKDRQIFRLECMTDKGPMILRLSAERLDRLITNLMGLEHLGSAIDPTKDVPAGEPLTARAYFVDNWKIGQGDMRGEPHLSIQLKSGDLTRIFAMTGEQAAKFIEQVEDEIGRLRKVAKN